MSFSLLTSSRLCVYSLTQQPKSCLLPEAGRGGTEFPAIRIRDGANGARPEKPRRGHFQGRARQLTPSAFGRAYPLGPCFMAPRPKQFNL